MRTLYTYWRSSTAYRVRIALNLKGLAYSPVYVSLPKMQHRAADYLGVNPQGLVPALVEDGRMLGQSLAIIEYLEERHPAPALLPKDPFQRAYVRMLAQLVACDIHPVNNVRILRYLEKELGAAEPARLAWYGHWIAEGLGAFEAMLAKYALSGSYCCGDEVGLADVCLVPQAYNARRYGCPLGDYPRLRAIAERCERLPEFVLASPDAQEDAVK